MTDTRANENAGVHVEVAIDKMTATLVIDAGDADITVGDVFARIRKLGVRGFDDGAIIQALTERNGQAVRLDIAHGENAVDAEPDTLEWLIVPGDAVTGDLGQVHEGDVLATIHAGKAGTDGYDVFRKPLPAKRHERAYVGPGVAIRDDKLVATRTGGFNLQKGVASVRPIVKLDPRDLPDTSTKPIDGDVLVQGSIKRRVQTTGCMVVEGGIDGASFKSGEWTHVRDSIDGGERVKGIIGGDLSCAGARSVRLIVAGNVTMRGPVIDSVILCVGRFNAAEHDIQGGEIIANGGAVCHTLGSPDGKPTIVEVGVDGPLRETLEEARPMIDAYHQQLAQANDRVKPLMGHMALSATQKERVTEVLYELDALQHATQKKLAGLLERCKAASEAAAAELTVTGTIHVGVVVRFAQVEARIEETITGPVRLLVRTDLTGASVVCEDANGNPTTLRSSPRDGDYHATIERLLHA